MERLERLKILMGFVKGEQAFYKPEKKVVELMSDAYLSSGQRVPVAKILIKTNKEEEVLVKDLFTLKMVPDIIKYIMDKIPETDGNVLVSSVVIQEQREVFHDIALLIKTLTKDANR